MVFADRAFASGTLCDRACGARPNCPPLQAPCKVAALSGGTPCMARDQVDMTPVETREELVAWFEAGSKPKSQFRIGTENEKFVFTVDGHRPVPYDGRRSIRALLEGMQYLLVFFFKQKTAYEIGLFDVIGGG